MYKYSFTPEIVRHLLIMEWPMAEVASLKLLPDVAEGLRLRARLRSTHFSTRIEGNRLTLAEVEQAVLDGRKFPGRERDTREVQYYFKALTQVEAWVEEGKPITEERICQLHSLIFTGKGKRPTSYRDGQNVIKDSSGGIVYLPPEASDVPNLMKELTKWIQNSEQELPVPVIAGIAHYQFLVVHPYYNGNGRTARALATWILHRGGYDLGQFYALEEFYAQDLQGYYDALVTHPNHNYYFGRADADITPWLAYFLKGMAAVFETMSTEIRSQALAPDEKVESLLNKLDQRSRKDV